LLSSLRTSIRLITRSDLYTPMFLRELESCQNLLIESCSGRQLQYD
jgi:hypothetical protein